MNRHLCLMLPPFLFLPLGFLPLAAAIADPAGPITDYLTLPAVVEYDKSPVHQDPIDAAIANGTWRAPNEGETVTAIGGKTSEWSPTKTPNNGLLNDRRLAGGYAFATVDSPDERVMLLRATRHASVRVNDAWLAGDPYGLGFVELPVRLRRGANELLFHVARPGMRAELVTPEAGFKLLTADAVLPDVVRGEGGQLWGAVPLVNASAEPLIGARVATKIGSDKPVAIDLPRIEPLTVYKLKFRLNAPQDAAGDKVELRVAVVRVSEASEVSTQAEQPSFDNPADDLAEGANSQDSGEQDPDNDPEADPSPGADAPQQAAKQRPEEIEVLARDLLSLKVVEPGGVASRTFVSRVDGSVQRYAVLPASKKADADETATLLSLHDFGVDCREHAARYKAKAWAHVVAPQGRRRHGFDWEAWGASDALEALEHATQRYPANPRRTCLTGVGAGGHGAWLIGAQHADRFAAVAPVGGWLSYWSRGAGMPAYDNPTPVEGVLARSAAGSDPLAVLRNLASPGVYLLHEAGGRYVSQGRFARRRLADFHNDFVYFEHPTPTPTVDDRPDTAVDWPGLMDFFRRHESPEQRDIRRVDFATVRPGLSARSAWATIESQEQAFKPSRVTLEHEPRSRSFTGQTDNVARLSLDIGHLPREDTRPIRVRLDDSPAIAPRRPQPRRGDATRRLWFGKNEDGRWRQTPPPGGDAKTARRSGAFKSVFDRDALLVYGTAGNDAENRWAEAKARYDAQTFWVRGGGALDVLPDTAFNPLTNVNRNVVLYGNADTNSAWPPLLSSSPVQVRRDQVYVGVRPELGSDVGVLMVRPRRGSRTALVGVVGGSGVTGMRLTNRLRYFFSGIGYPDLTILGPRGPLEGSAGVRATGSFGPDWSLEKGDVAWRDLAL